MNKSSKLKNIISFLLVTVLVMSVIVLPVSADTTKQVTYPAGTYPDNNYHPEYEYFGNCPVYTSDELVYTGEKSTDLTASFNLVQQYDMSFCKNSGFYMSRPFEYRSRWDYGQPAFINFGSADSAYNQMFTKTKFDSLTTDFVTENNIDMDTYDIYYLVYQDYSPTREYGYLYMDYICVPKNSRIAISNENKPDGSKDSSEIHYGLVLPANYKSVFYAETWINGETSAVNNTPTHFAGTDFWNFLGMGHHSTIATNIPIFTLKADADMYVTTGKPLNDPSNKIPSGSDLGINDRLSASSFGWDSFKCRLSQSGKAYNFIYNYTYSSSDMKKDPSSYFMDIEYSQVIRYRNRVNASAYEDKTATKKSCMLVSSTGTSTDSLSVIDTKGNFGQQFIYTICLLVDEASSFFGSGTDLTNIDIYSSNIYVTVKLRHKRILSDNPILEGVDKILSDISSDVRTFKFNALDLSSLDSPEEITSDVITKDAVDSDGNVITDSNGNPVKEVSQIITNDNSSHTTINNYYYNSDGKQSTSPDGSSIGDSLSDIASGLIKFIKTLVTEGLPAALEVLKTLIKSVSDLVGFAFDQIGDIGAGTSQGLIAVLKAIPTPLWGICSVGLIVFVIAGVLKKIF
ncbi:MAG: hypothetical protein PUF75_03275 [Coprococcus sp.]|nr:hypothetical protein [Coprococcus sp.]